MEIDLHTALQTMVDGMQAQENTYLVSTNYYVFKGKHIDMAILVLQKDAVWNMEIEEDGFKCDLLLDRSNPNEKSSIYLPYEAIWKVQQSRKALSADESVLYYNREKLLHYVAINLKKENND